MLKSLYRLLASLKLAVTLIIVLAAVLAWATILESRHGRELAQWYVYGAPWFLFLLAALGVNILAATLIRIPWRRRQTGFVITHAGLLVLLAGSVQTFFAGIDGQVTLRQGRPVDHVLITNRSRITALRKTDQGRVSSEFSFQPGAVDWPDDRQLDFGDADGFGLKVVKFYRHGREQTEWVEDPLDYQGSVLRLALCGPDFRPIATEWLSASTFGGEAVLGPAHFDLWPVPVASMVQDFLDPPQDDLGESGVLSVHWNGQMQRYPVANSLGKPITLEGSGIVFEIAEYLPNAKPNADGTFVSSGMQAENPLLELKVQLPDQDQPRRQIAFAKLPLLTLDAVHGTDLPVKFWYHHPQVTPIAGAAFVQGPDGTLYCRSVRGNAYQQVQTVKQGDRIPLDSEFNVLVEKHLPHARQEVSFLPVELGPGESTKNEAVALVEVRTGRQSRRVWLRRNDDQYGMRRIVTDTGPVALSFTYDQVPLGFQLELKEFRRELNPGRVGNASFASTVRVVDPAGPVDEQREISMNEPLVHDKFTLYQSSFREEGDGTDVSILTAAYDPGRFLKYLGSLMICIGIAVMFYMRSYLFQKVPLFRSPGRDAATLPCRSVEMNSNSTDSVAGAA